MNDALVITQHDQRKRVRVRVRLGDVRLVLGRPIRIEQRRNSTGSHGQSLPVPAPNTYKPVPVCSGPQGRDVLRMS
jgi:hypothetical protein